MQLDWHTDTHTDLTRFTRKLCILYKLISNSPWWIWRLCKKGYGDHTVKLAHYLQFSNPFRNKFPEGKQFSEKLSVCVFSKQSRNHHTETMPLSARYDTNYRSKESKIDEFCSGVAEWCNSFKNYICMDNFCWPKLCAFSLTVWGLSLP